MLGIGLLLYVAVPLAVSSGIEVAHVSSFLSLSITEWYDVLSCPCYTVSSSQFV